MDRGARVAEFLPPGPSRRTHRECGFSYHRLRKISRALAGAYPAFCRFNKLSRRGVAGGTEGLLDAARKGLGRNRHGAAA